MINLGVGVHLTGDQRHSDVRALLAVASPVRGRSGVLSVALSYLRTSFSIRQRAHSCFQSHCGQCQQIYKQREATFVTAHLYLQRQPSHPTLENSDLALKVAEDPHHRLCRGISGPLDHGQSYHHRSALTPLRDLSNLPVRSRCDQCVGSSVVLWCIPSAGESFLPFRGLPQGRHAHIFSPRSTRYPLPPSLYR